MCDVTTPASVDHVMTLFKYLWPVSTSGSSSEAHSAVCLVKEKGKPISAYIKLSMEKKAETGKYASEN